MINNLTETIGGINDNLTKIGAINDNLTQKITETNEKIGAVGISLSNAIANIALKIFCGKC